MWIDERPLNRIAERLRHPDHDGVDGAGVGLARESERLGDPRITRDDLHEHVGLQRRPPANEPTGTASGAVTSANAAPRRPGLGQGGELVVRCRDPHRRAVEFDDRVGADTIVDQRRLRGLSLQPHHVEVAREKLAADRHAAAMTRDPQTERPQRSGRLRQTDPQFAGARRLNHPPVERAIPIGGRQGTVTVGRRHWGGRPLDGLHRIDEPFRCDAASDHKGLARGDANLARRATEHRPRRQFERRDASRVEPRHTRIDRHRCPRRGRLLLEMDRRSLAPDRRPTRGEGPAISGGRRHHDALVDIDRRNGECGIDDERRAAAGPAVGRGAEHRQGERLVDRCLSNPVDVERDQGPGE